MAEFRTMYYGPMDREYHQAISEAPSATAIEEPIFPISQLGETVPEHDPTGRFKNVLQTTQAAIRGGAGTLQIVLMTSPESPIGGRPKAYGREVRAAIKEAALASQVNIAGIELPTALNNMAGFDYQQLIFSDDRRKQNLDEVKDALHFAADVGKGGGVDIVSWEFPRSINEADWQRAEKKQFEHEGETRIGWLVDERTGKTIQFRKDEIQHIPWQDEFKKLSGVKEPTREEITEQGGLKLAEFKWDNFVELAKKESKETGIHITPEQKYVEVQLGVEIKSLEGWRTTYLERAKEYEKRIAHEQNKEKHEQNKEELELLKKQRDDFLNSAYGNQQKAMEMKERIKHLKQIDEYAISRSARSYAEAGIEAMKTYETGREKGTITKPLYVGPEIGWPNYYGSHPDEFIHLVKKSREEMIALLTKQKITMPDAIKGTVEKDNPYYSPGINHEKAKELADKHIKGLFDTAHMGMWLAHFKPKPGENEEQRIQRFKTEFYLPAVKKIAESGVVGGVQLVDSMSAAHGHLPPGQGIYPVKEAAQIFKETGFTGFVVSEGHEEERFGEGRIRLKTWQMAGAKVGAGYFGGPPLRWGQTENSYFGRTYSPMFMFGSYAPSNEFKLWSEMPLE